MNTIPILLFAWIAGGALFIRAATVTAPNESTVALMAGLRHGEAAAFVALAAFVAIWPVIWIGAHVSKWRGGR